MANSGPEAGTSKVVIPAEYLAATRDKLSVDQRIALARKPQFLDAGDTLTDAERDVLRRILHIVAQDAEIRVRQALAETLADKTAAPHDVVLALARDDELVASSILRMSEVLTPDDIVAIIQSQKNHVKMAAIAERRGVPPAVCMALIEHGNDVIAGKLLQNPGAELSETGLNRIVDRYGKAKAIQSEIISRDALPATVIEKVVSLVSTELLTRLTERHKLPEAVSTKLALEMRDRAVFGFTFGLSSEGMSNLVDQLLSENRLTPGLVLRSLVVGNLELIVHTMALRCQLGIDYARDRLIQADPAGVKKLWEAAELPANYLPLAMVAIGVLVDARSAGAHWPMDYCRAQIVERFLKERTDAERLLGEDGMKFLRAARSNEFQPT
jgi:uncharacterized protein (DUF2336 family)